MQRILKESAKLVGCLVEGRFLIEEIIGVGGLSTVYLAGHNRADLKVAVKIMHSNLTDTEESIERFRREAEIINKLNHPNVVHIYSAGVLEGELKREDGTTMRLETPRPYLVLERLHGQDLDNVLKKVGRFDEKESYRIISSVLKALSEAHQLGIIHRDIKPSNVMLVDKVSCFDKHYPLDQFEPVKLLDFGIAKCMRCYDENRDRELTQPGMVFGSPLYMSPEQCLGRELDCRTDIYSLGCMYFRMLTGRAPFEGESPMHTFAMHMYETPPPLTELLGADGPAPDPRLVTLINSCLSKKADERPASAAEMLAELQSFY